MVSRMPGNRRIYVCHTFYHAYIACVKELLLAGEENKNSGSADLILSMMSNQWGDFPEKLGKRTLFRRILFFDEQNGAEHEQLNRLRQNRGSLAGNLLQRIRYTRLLGRLQEPHVPVDFRDYDEVNVFCDSDPIGYYLNLHRIRYHALEDGLNCDKLDDMARLSNAGAFRLKALLAKLGLIFIPNGYSRYCMDYEVNDLSVNPDFPANTVAVPRRPLMDRLTAADHSFLAEVFLPDADGLRALMAGCRKPVAMILTEPLCELPVRARLFGDLVERYTADYDVIIKPHPRDGLDYNALFADRMPAVYILTGRFPMEALDDLEEFRVAKLVSVITQVDDVRFAAVIDYMGLDFLDRYEDPAVHRKMERERVLALRPAREQDSDWWLFVRNDEISRRYSFQQERIDPAVHARWFAGKLADPREQLFVLEEDKTPVGQLRLSVLPAEAGSERDEVEISYAVAPNARGRGMGRKLLEEALRVSRESYPACALRAEVKAENEVSRHLFSALGFEESPAGNGVVVYRL
ncbi:MAG: GNAT family N-acetyltransferase [Lachnospiraceae bacterium]|nr:GNAT family N-acetyltransferase [Lachnospiraceae bacterium]